MGVDLLDQEARRQPLGRRGRGQAFVEMGQGGLLDRHLPLERRSLQYFICAGEQTVRSVEETLLDLGIPGDSIHSEKFGMV